MLITGAGKRIGRHLAGHFAARGWNLVLHYHRAADEARALAEQLRADHGVDVALLQADLAVPFAEFWHGVPPCEAILHNAATFERDTLPTMESTQLQQQVQVNFLTPLQLTQGFMQQLPGGAHGQVILFGDGALGWSISPEFFSYAASKQALHGCVDLLAAACAPRVRVNMVALGPTLPAAHEDPAMYARLAQQMPLKRTSSQEEVCDAIDFLLKADGVTGQVINLAGGAHLATART